MEHAPGATSIAIRPAVSEDARGIARVFLQSAEYHAGLDPERYFIPTLEKIAAHYRNLWQQSAAREQSITLVAEIRREIVGFVDARLDRSPDAMHREVVYCHIAEIAVDRAHQDQGIGGRLIEAAENWGRQQGAEFSSLEYHAANARAAEFYQRSLGYRAAAVTAIKRL